MVEAGGSRVLFKINERFLGHLGYIKLPYGQRSKLILYFRRSRNQ